MNICPDRSGFLTCGNVELVRRYSNRPDLQERLAEVARRASQSGDRHEPDEDIACASGQVPGVWRVRDRLTAADVEQLIADFRAGTSKRVLADRYVVSFSTVKRILKTHGVRRLLELK